MYDARYGAVEYANAAKYLLGEPAFTACERAVMAYGRIGHGKEYSVMRYSSDTLIPPLALVSRQVICSYVAEKGVGLSWIVLNKL